MIIEITKWIKAVLLYISCILMKEDHMLIIILIGCLKCMDGVYTKSGFAALRDLYYYSQRYKLPFDQASKVLPDVLRELHDGVIISAAKFVEIKLSRYGSLLSLPGFQHRHQQIIQNPCSTRFFAGTALRRWQP